MTKDEKNAPFNYWKNMCNLIKADEIKEVLPTDPIRKMSYAADFFDKGIILLLNSEDGLGRDFLSTTLKIYRTLGKNADIKTSDDFARHFFTDLMISNDPSWDLLKASIDLKEVQVVHDIEKFQSWDIYNATKTVLAGILDKYSQAVESNLTKDSIPEKYPYEEVADQLVALGRRNLLIGEVKKARDIAQVALDLYAIAKNRVDDGGSRKSVKKKKKKALEEINEEKLLASSYGFGRDDLLGNIPLFTIQAELIKKLGTLSMGLDSFSEKDAKKDMEYFFKSIINPPERKISALGFLDEVEWAFIRKVFYVRFYGFDLRGEWGEVLRKSFLSK